MLTGWTAEWNLQLASLEVQTRAEIGTAGPEVLSLRIAPSMHVWRAVAMTDKHLTRPEIAPLLSLLFHVFRHKIGFVPLANPFELKRIIPFLVGVLLLFLGPGFILGAEKG